MKFLTDFADQAVVLPLVFAVSVVLACQGWRRGAAAWLVTIGGTFAAMLVLKLGFLGCVAVDSLRSPSGHVAAATVVCGCLATIYGCGWRGVAVAALLAGTAIGLTRVGLHEHSWQEVVVGGAVGLLGAMAMPRLAGPAPALRVRPMVLTATFVVAALHGTHLEAEMRIRKASTGLPSWCQARP